MVELTIGDLLRWKAAHMTLVGAWQAQRAAVEGEFSWAVSIRATTPVLPPLRGRELIIVPRDVLAELDQRESIRWPQVVDHLRTLPIAAVITDHPGIAAGIEGLVVIEAAATGGTDLEVSLNREFTERRGSLYQLGSELARTFSSASIGGSALDGFLSSASERTGIPVALIAATGRVLAASTQALSVPPELAHPDSAGRRQTLAGMDWISRPVIGVGLPEGVSIVVALATTEAGDRARLLLEQTGEALGLMFDRLPPVETGSTVHSAGDLLSELALTGTLPPAARRRLTQAAGRLDLNGALRLVTAADQWPEAALSFEHAGARFQLIAAGAPDVKEALLSGAFISPPFRGIEAMPPALELVVKALRLRESGFISAQGLDLGEPGCAGVMGLVLLLQGRSDDISREFEDYARALLGALEDYDRARDMQLVETLGVYLDAGASIALAAQRLGVHRNTLAYRTARIAEVSGHNLADPGVRFDLQLAIALRRLNPPGLDRMQRE